MRLCDYLFHLSDLDLPHIVKNNTGTSIELQCRSNGLPPPSYYWTHFGEIVGKNDSRLILKEINDTYIATYKCHVKNVAGEYTVMMNANDQCMS